MLCASMAQDKARFWLAFTAGLTNAPPLQFKSRCRGTLETGALHLEESAFSFGSPAVSLERAV